MGEIPDWLMQMASGEEEEEQDDFGMAPPLEEEPEPMDDVYGLMGLTAPGDAPDPMDDAIDPMAALRTEIDGTEEVSNSSSLFESMTAPTTGTPTSSLTLGLLPWQRFFLSILLFLDVAIIGLLFLVMLGSISIPTF